MTISEKILKHIQGLPEPLQVEVLDFVEYLESKVGKGKKGEEESEWSTLSLAFAMRGMKDEHSPYSLDDIKKNFQTPKPHQEQTLRLG